MNNKSNQAEQLIETRKKLEVEINELQSTLLCKVAEYQLAVDTFSDDVHMLKNSFYQKLVLDAHRFKNKLKINEEFEQQINMLENSVKKQINIFNKIPAESVCDRTDICSKEQSKIACKEYEQRSASKKIPDKKENNPLILNSNSNACQSSEVINEAPPLATYEPSKAKDDMNQKMIKENAVNKKTHSDCKELKEKTSKDDQTNCVEGTEKILPESVTKLDVSKQGENNELSEQNVDIQQKESNESNSNIDLTNITKEGDLSNKARKKQDIIDDWLA